MTRVKDGRIKCIISYNRKLTANDNSIYSAHSLRLALTLARSPCTVSGDCYGPRARGVVYWKRQLRGFMRADARGRGEGGAKVWLRISGGCGSCTAACRYPGGTDTKWKRTVELGWEALLSSPGLVLWRCPFSGYLIFDLGLVLLGVLESSPGRENEGRNNGVPRKEGRRRAVESL